MANKPILTDDDRDRISAPLRRLVDEINLPYDKLVDIWNDNLKGEAASLDTSALQRVLRTKRDKPAGKRKYDIVFKLLHFLIDGTPDETKRNDWSNQLAAARDDYDSSKRTRSIIGDQDSKAAPFTESSIAARDQVLDSPRLYEFIQDLYQSHPTLQRCGQRYPVAILDHTPCRFGAPEMPALHRPTRWSPDPENQEFIIHDHRYRLERQRLSPVDPKHTYRMTEAKPQDGKTIISFDIGRYDLMIDTCDCLQDELLSVCAEDARWKQLGTAELLEKLPLRRRLHECVKDPVRDGQGRSTAMAMSVLTSFRDAQAENNSFVWARRRSGRGVAVNPGAIHVIPSFMFQPEYGYPDEEFNLLYAIRKEFLEELFNAKPPPGEVQYTWFDYHPPIVDLDNMLATGQAELWYTGLIVNLLNLRPEICCVLRILDQEWFTRSSYAGGKVPGTYLAINEEFEGHEVVEQQGRPFLPRVKYNRTDTDETLLVASGMTPGGSVPPGAAAFWFGMDLIRQLESTRP